MNIMKYSGRLESLIGYGALAALLLTSFAGVQASPVVTPWTPVFKGIDRLSGTNAPGGAGSLTNLQVMFALRVDLTDPDIRFLTTPRFSNYVAGVQETAGFTVADFLKTHQLQAAINANFFQPGTYYLPAGTPMTVSGLAVSEGTVVSDQEGVDASSSLVLDASNQGSIIMTNWPPTNTAGIFTAVSGLYPLLIDGTNVAYSYLSNPDFIHQPNPRTVFGLSRDRRYLFLVTIDGRQPGYSDGAYDYESAEWLLLLGASDAVNMDGGGSTTLVIEDTTGFPLPLNHSSAVANDPQGRERTVGSHFGIYAKPAPGFINDVVSAPQDVSATISWSTILPADSQVQYDTSTNFSLSSALQPALVTNHSVVLTGLTPDTGYYFRALSSDGTNQHVSPNYYFVTTNYAVATPVFDVTNSWRYSKANLDGIDWTVRGYNDSAWSGPGPGLLWIDLPPVNNAVQPKNTQLPGNPGNGGLPYLTYYFRTHFTITNAAVTTALRFSCFIDDGAVFYLNGAEINRIRMDPYPTPILNDTLAMGTPLTGDATAPEEFAVSGNLMTNLVTGDNVLAVEVHNSHPNSADLTFGVALTEVQPGVPTSPQLSIADTDGVVTLSWNGSGFNLQESGIAGGGWTNVPGPITTSPFVVTNATDVRYYRLIR